MLRNNVEQKIKPDFADTTNTTFLTPWHELKVILQAFFGYRDASATVGHFRRSRMKIAVIAENRPGISTTLMGEQVMGQLKDQGHEVVPVYVHGNVYKLMPEIARMPTICLSEHEMRGILRNSRYARPTALISVLTGDWEEHNFPDRMAYLAMFFEPVLNGIPLRHVSHSKHTTDLMLGEARSLLSPSVVQEPDEERRDPLLRRRPRLSARRERPRFPDRPVQPDRPGGEERRPALGTDPSVPDGGRAARVSRRGRSSISRRGTGRKTRASSSAASPYEISQQPDTREGYVANARRCGLFFSVAQYESFGIYYMELLFAGAVGVFLDRPWVRRLIPEYPFIVGKSEIVPCMLHIRENYDQVREPQVDKVLPALRERFSLAGFTASLVRDLEEMIPMQLASPEE